METKPTSFARGVPPEERNGFFGIEEELMARPGDHIVAVVTFVVDEVMHKEVAGERYPVVKLFQIEPLHDGAAVDAAVALRDAARAARTGQEALELPEVDD